MSAGRPDEITQLLHEWSRGNDSALPRLVELVYPELHRIVELRYFAGLSIEETAEALNTSPSTVKRGWLAAKTFIRRRLDGNVSSP